MKEEQRWAAGPACTEGLDMGGLLFLLQEEQFSTGQAFST